MGEGGGIMVLESEIFAKRRGSVPRAILHRPALSSEAYNIISPDPKGDSLVHCMKSALDNAGLCPADIDYINAHGTSTILNDLVETRAIKNVFKDAARDIAISSTKSATGHCLAGAAGVEAVITVKAIEEGIVPPTLNLEKTEPEMDLDFTPKKAVRREVNHAMSNAFAFGGHNGSLVFSKITE
jgi:3-oxoacyl-[acyl-carrier-protein] synthase II